MTEPIRNLPAAVAAMGALPMPVGAEPEPDGITQLIAPTQALREPEGEFYDFVHHDHRTPHDLEWPEPGGVL